MYNMQYPIQPIRWGILGTGRIAGIFAEGLRTLPDARLVAVGSRSAARAEHFGALYDVPRRYSSYTALVADPAVDIVYVTSPHALHCEHTLLALQAGKPVLCEKPFALNARQAAAMIDAARARNLLLVEAMWTRWLPLMARLRELLAEQMIGAVRMLRADFGFRATPDPQHRLFNPALGGGALLDVGVYCISFASMLFGTPTQITGLATLGGTGVDEQAAIVLGYAGGQLATLTTAIRTNIPHEALILGTAGYIRLHEQWWCPTRLTVQRDGQPAETIALPYQGNGYHYEAAEAMRCLRAGEIESPVLPHAETLVIMQTLDALRAQWGLRYPGE